MLNFLRICKEFFKVTVPFYTPPGNEPWMRLRRTDAEGDTPICGCLMWRASPLGETLMLGKTGGRRRSQATEAEMVGWHHRLDGHEWVNSRREWRTGKPGVLQFTGSQRVGQDWATEQEFHCFISSPTPSIDSLLNFDYYNEYVLVPFNDISSFGEFI